MMRDDWTEVKVGNLFKTVTGNTPPKKEINNYGDYLPFIKPPELEDKPITKASEFLSVEGSKKGRTVPKGSILITCIGNLGRTGLSKYDIAFNQQITAIEPIKGIDSKYIFYQCQSPLFRNSMEKLSSATTVTIINKRKFNSINFVVAPLPEQRAIVAKIEQLFSELDNGIANIKKAKEKLEVYRQAVLKKAFEGELTSNKKRVNMNFTFLGDLIEKPKYGTSKKCSYESSGTPVLRIPNIGEGVVDHNDLKYAEFDKNESETLSLQEGDLLTIRSNGSVALVGKCALVRKFDTHCLYAGYLIRLRPIPERINSKYLLYCLSSHELRIQIESKAKSTSGVNNINSQELASLKLPICSLEEQEAIVEAIETRLSVCDNILANINEGLKKAEVLRQSILKKAFEGRILDEDELEDCRKETDWEPAKKLLERIKNEVE